MHFKGFVEVIDAAQYTEWKKLYRTKVITPEYRLRGSQLL